MDAFLYGVTSSETTKTRQRAIVNIIYFFY